MKKTILYIVPLMLLTLGMVSCSSDDIDSKTRDVKNREYIGAQIFIAADLTQHINILQVILRDLARNASIILDETDR